MATEMLNAMEAYIQRAKADPRWKRQYQYPQYGRPDLKLSEITQEIISSYPNLKKQRIVPPVRRCPERSPSAVGNLNSRVRRVTSG